MQKQKLLLIIVLVVLNALSIKAQDEESLNKDDGRGPLDGKTFVGEAGEKGKETGEPNEFIFGAGKFSSITFGNIGFESGAYTSTNRGDSITFEATTLSSSEGKIDWKGTVSSDSIEGTFTWLRSGTDAPAEYWFKGKLKEEQV